MLSNSLKRLNRTNRLITVDDISDNLLAGRSAAHTTCWKYLQQASYDAALDQAISICQREPERPDGFVFRARALFKLKRYTEAEEVLLHVMKIAEKNDLIRTDVEGMIKLKDELANSRVEILRENRFQKPLEIADRHWNDYHKPILEVIGFARQSRAVERPMDADIEIIDIIGAERAKQIYPDLLANAPKHKSTPIGGPSTSYWRPGASHSNVDLRHELREREGNVSHSGDQKKVDEQLRITGLKTSLMLAEEKAQTFDRKNRELESELKKVYQHLLKVNAEKKQLLRKCDTLEAQLDRAFGQSSVASTSVAPKRKIVPKRQFVDFPDQRYLAVKSRKLKDYVVTKTRQKYRRIARIGRKRVAYGGAQSSMASTSAPKRALNVERYPADRPPNLRGYGFTNYNRNGANYERRPEPQEPYEDDGLYEIGNYRALCREEFDRIQ